MWNRLPYEHHDDCSRRMPYSLGGQSILNPTNTRLNKSHLRVDVRLSMERITSPITCEARPTYCQYLQFTFDYYRFTILSSVNYQYERVSSMSIAWINISSSLVWFQYGEVKHGTTYSPTVPVTIGNVKILINQHVVVTLCCVVVDWLTAWNIHYFLICIEIYLAHSDNYHYISSLLHLSDFLRHEYITHTQIFVTASVFIQYKHIGDTPNFYNTTSQIVIWQR